MPSSSCAGLADLAVANDRLIRAEELAAPTRTPLDELRKIIDDHRQFDSTRRILDEWDDLDGASKRATDLCQALDRWKEWAGGRDVSAAKFVEIASALHDHQDLRGTSPLGESLSRWADTHGVEVRSPNPRLPSIETGVQL